MKNKGWIITGLVFLAITLFFLGIGLSKETQVNTFKNIPAEMKKVTFYKDPNCGCCEGHAKMYRNAGFEVDVQKINDMESIKDKSGIPLNMQSCHTAMIGDYFVEGHVPLEAIKKLINESPDIKGIMLPGMPSGTPGMPGMKVAPYKISSMDQNNTIKEFITI